MEQRENVSVVMCTYNGARYLREQLDSILAQTYPIHELIVQDDGSTDGTEAIVAEYAARHPFIRFCRNRAEKGVNGNFYSAMRLATGDLIAISDQDDIWEPRKIEWQVATIGEAWLSAGITCPFVDGEDPRAEAYFDERLPNIRLERMIYISMIAGHTMMLRREFLDKVFALEAWRKDYMYDWFLQIVAGAYEKIAYIDRILVHQRKHITSATYAAPIDNRRNLRNVLTAVRRTYRQYMALRPAIQSYFKGTYELLAAIPAETESRRAAMELARYESRSGWWNGLRLMMACVRLRDRLFYARGEKGLFTLLRALYFPVSCSDYFRYLKP